MLTLDHNQQAVIASVVRNGLGLTDACSGLHLEPKEVSEYIRSNPSFQSLLNEQVMIGYKSLIIAMNEASNKKIWDRWRATRESLNVIIRHVNLWESRCTKEQWSFENFTTVIRDCKTVRETATAMGLTESEIWKLIYADTGLIKWLMQNNYDV